MTDGELQAATEGVKPTFADPERAAEAGRRSGEVRRRKATMTPEQRALDAIGSRLPRLTNELLDAALGEGDFETLKLETRVKAMTDLMAWKLGRPAAVKPPAEETPDSTPEDGDALFE